MTQPPSRDVPTIRVVAGLVEKHGRYLVTQRRPGAVLPLLWEFPGGRCEPGESDQDALRRELYERLEAEVDVRQLISFVHHGYARYCVELYLYACDLISEELCPRAVHAYRWVRSEEFDDLEFTPADEASVAQLLGLA